MKKKGFTLIELLAVIVILAIIALIATPLIINVINTAKKDSAAVSTKNYLRAVELAVMNADLSTDIDLSKRIEFEIIDEKKIYSNNNTSDPSDDITIEIKYNGKGLTEGIIILDNHVVVKTFDIIFDNNYFVFIDDNKNIVLEENKDIRTLVMGGTFNARIKNLANNITENDTQMTYESEDTAVQSIEFYSFGRLPNGHTEETLIKLPSVDVSNDKNKSIMAYNDNGKIYVCSNGYISFPESSNYMFYNFKTLKSIKSNYIITKNIKNMTRMFRNCIQLVELDVSNWNTGSVTSMKETFLECNNLIYLDVSNWNTSQVTSMHRMFANCGSLTNLDVSNFNTSKVKDMSFTFSGCSSLTELDVSNWDTSQVTSLYMTFNGCKNVSELDISNWDTNQVTSLYRTFDNCAKLTKLDVSNWNTDNLTDMYATFQGCSGLTSLDLRNFNTQKVTNMSFMFRYCSKLKSIFVGKNWFIPENAGSMFLSCATKNEEDLCKPGSTNEWCVIR